MSWIGGKKALRDEILIRFPAEYARYIEVFGGAGWVLFHKQPKSDFEVYNDFNPNLANLYRCVRDKPDELIAELEFALNSRLDFRHIRQELKKPAELPDIKRAAYFYQLIRQSYASGIDSFASQPDAMWSSFPLIRAACRRLQRVVVENKVPYFKHIYNDNSLPNRAKLVYVYLHDRMDDERKTWPGIKRIGSDLSLSRSTVKRAINDLVTVGYVRKEVAYRDNGSHTSNRYFIVK